MCYPIILYMQCFWKKFKTNSNNIINYKISLDTESDTQSLI